MHAHIGAVLRIH